MRLDGALLRCRNHRQPDRRNRRGPRRGLPQRSRQRCRRALRDPFDPHHVDRSVDGDPRRCRRVTPGPPLTRLAPRCGRHRDRSLGCGDRLLRRRPRGRPCVNGWWDARSRIGDQLLCERFGSELNWHTRFHLLAHAAPASVLLGAYLWAIRRWGQPGVRWGRFHG